MEPAIRPVPVLNRYHYPGLEITAMKNLSMWASTQTGMVCPLMIGAPGCAKTTLSFAIGAATGRRVFSFVGGIHEPTDLVCPDKVNKNGHDCIAMLPADWAVDMLTGKWLLLLDELTNCSEPMHTAMMSIMLEGRVGNLQLPSTVWRVAACNPLYLAANGHQLPPPVVTRIPHFQWERDDESFEAGMSAGICRPDGNGGWQSLFPLPSFPILPDDWWTRMAHIGNLTRAYRQKHPGSTDRTPAEDDQDARDKTARPYPCQRTWRNLVVCRAATEACGGDASDVLTAMAANIGEAEALSVQQFEKDLNLPDPEDVLQVAMAAITADKPVTFTPPQAADQAIVLLSGIVQRALMGGVDDSGHVSMDITAARWKAGVLLMDEARKRTPEIVAAVAPPLIQSRPKGAEIPVEFVDFFCRVLKGIGGLKLD
jgi:hypothetical protein